MADQPPAPRCGAEASSIGRSWSAVGRCHHHHCPGTGAGSDPGRALWVAPSGPTAPSTVDRERDGRPTAARRRAPAGRRQRCRNVGDRSPRSAARPAAGESRGERSPACCSAMPGCGRRQRARGARASGFASPDPSTFIAGVATTSEGVGTARSRRSRSPNTCVAGLLGARQQARCPVLQAERRHAVVADRIGLGATAWPRAGSAPRSRRGPASAAAPAQQRAEEARRQAQWPPTGSAGTWNPRSPNSVPGATEPSLAGRGPPVLLR